MADTSLPENLVALQRSAHLAWADLKQHRRNVQALREKDSPEKDRELPACMSRTLRDWSEEEDARHLELQAAAVTAQEALLRGFTDAGFKRDAATVPQLGC
jgi:hypothetical protein